MSHDDGDFVWVDANGLSQHMPRAAPGNYYPSTHVSGGNVLQGDNYGSITFSNYATTPSRSIAESLWYSEMNARLNEIKTARHNTFEWVFDDDVDQSAAMHNNEFLSESLSRLSSAIALRKQEACKLRKWLEYGSCIYLIQGKAGAGKSTFMKFLFEHPSTVSLLMSSTETTVPSLLFHSFWRVGNPIQCSLRGFLASMLFQVLADQPELEVACRIGVRGQHMKRSLCDWSEKELILSLLAALVKTSRPLCMFVDGIDELHPDDDTGELLQLLTQISSTTSCKLLISSRPLTNVIQCFESSEKTRLQDFTHADIYTYIEKEIETSWMVKQRTSDPRVPHLTETISHKAQGVFIWVYLVVKDVIRGIAQGDNLLMLEKRVEIMPSQIEKLYEHMLARYSSDTALYAEQASLIFSFGEFFPMALPRLVIATDSTLCESLLTEQKPRDSTELVRLCGKFAREVETRCAGLIECVTPEQPPEEDGRISAEPGPVITSSPPESGLRSYAQYIHRSVHEFLSDTAEGQRILRGQLRHNQIQLSLVRSILACLSQGVYELTKECVLLMMEVYLYDAESEVAHIIATIARVCESIVDSNTSLLDWETKSDWYRRLCLVDDSKYPGMRQSRSTRYISYRPMDFPSVVCNHTAVCCVAYHLKTEGKTWSRYYKGYLATTILRKVPQWHERARLVRVRDLISLLVAADADLVSNHCAGGVTTSCFVARPPAIECLAGLFTCALACRTLRDEQRDVLKLVQPYLKQIGCHLISITVKLWREFPHHYTFDARCGGTQRPGSRPVLLTFRSIDIVRLLQDIYSDHNEEQELGHWSETEPPKYLSSPLPSSCKTLFAQALTGVEQIHLFREYDREIEGSSWELIGLVSQHTTQSLRQAASAEITASSAGNVFDRIQDLSISDCVPFSHLPAEMYDRLQFPEVEPRPIDRYQTVHPTEWRRHCTMRDYFEQLECKSVEISASSEIAGEK